MWLNTNSRGSRLRNWQTWGGNRVDADLFKATSMMREHQTGSTQDRTALGVQVSPRRPIWNVNRTSEPGFGANECVPSGKWCKSTAFRHARVVQREPSAL